MNAPTVSFTLAWDGESFVAEGLRPLNFIVGPAGSSSLDFAQALAQTLPDSRFVGAERLQRKNDLAALLWHVHDPSVRHLFIDVPELDLAAGLQRDFMSELRVVARLHPHDPARKFIFLITSSPYVLDLAALDDACSVFYFDAAAETPVLIETPEPAEYDRLRACLAA